MSKPVTDMTPEEMDDYASQVCAILKVTGQESEAKAVYRLGEFIRELVRRIAVRDEEITQLNTAIKLMRL